MPSHTITAVSDVAVSPLNEEASHFKASLFTSIIAIVVGCSVLAGWAFDWENFKRILPRLVAMNPATALCFVAAGASLVCWARFERQRSQTQRSRVRFRSGARLLACIPLLAGALKLFSLTTGVDIPLDRWLFSARLADAATGFPNRMAPNTAFNLFFVGCALLFLDFRTRRGAIPSQMLAILAAIASLLALFGYAYGSKTLYGVASYIPMALHTALTFLVLVYGILAFNPRQGLMATFTDPGTGGLMARRLLPVVIGLPFVIGWLRLRGERAGLYDTALGVSLSVVASTTIFAAIVWWTANLLQTVDARRQSAEAERNTAASALRVAHEETQRRNAGMEADLLLAREIQQAFLPQQFISFPQPGAPVADALRFHHRYQPATALGGDFADVLLISDTKAGIFICDVMGHGVRSALVTAVVRGLAQELMTVATDPGQFLAQINRGLLAIFERTETPMFMTAFYLVADVETCEMHYASAGHPCPLRLRGASENGSRVEALNFGDATPGPALGIFSDSTYATCHSPLVAGDLIFLFTDGLVEIENHNGEEFDETHLMAAITQRASQAPAQLLDELLAEARSFAPHGEFEDDICLMGVEVTSSANK
ncbi:MAG TPA: PP2C family protein-serine/threonine phosphatase [Abditibacteriaceae bacterium]|jgi:serine phosphatase RsbU (regulator of sigma subunit)